MILLASSVAEAEAEAGAENVVIAALGDSLTQGYGLTPDKGLVAQLQAWLDGQGARVTLINAGVSGDTTAGGLARVGWTLTPEVQGLIVALGGNDMLRGLDPGAARANLSGILQAAQAAQVEVLLVGLNAPLNYGPDYKRDFDGNFPELAAEYGTLYLETMLGAIQDAAQETGRPLADLLQGDMIHPNAEGVGLIVERLGPKVLELAARIEGPD